MAKYKNEYRIESTRLKEWDYNIPWWYFVTINTKNHTDWFGNVIDNMMILNVLGETVKEEWMKTEALRKNVELDYYVIMPNHFHGIIIINDNSERRDVARYVSTASNNKYSEVSPKAGSLSAVIRSFKSAVTKRIHSMEYNDFCWQSRFYDRIIRNDKELFKIRKYIDENPMKWYLDKNNPENIFE